LGRYTLSIRLEEPEPPFLLYLTMPFCFAVPHEEAEKPRASFSSHPVGVGPFLLKEWRRGARLRFERNPNYYLPAQPWLDAVEVMIGPDEAIAQMMFVPNALRLAGTL
jgi:peptide/nickel transport system substrate-binding protein